MTQRAETFFFWTPKATPKSGPPSIPLAHVCVDSDLIPSVPKKPSDPNAVKNMRHGQNDAEPMDVGNGATPGVLCCDMMHHLRTIHPKNDCRYFEIILCLYVYLCVSELFSATFLKKILFLGANVQEGVDICEHIYGCTLMYLHIIFVVQSCIHLTHYI